MPAFKHFFLIPIINVLLINYCNNRNNNHVNFHYIPLNNNGMSYGDRNTTRCNRGQLIDLISYKFDNNLTEEAFSDTEELELYRMCSMQERCSNLHFPSRSAQKNDYNYYAAIKFQCIDPKTKNIMDMCDNSNRSFSDALHLMYNESVTELTMCTCWIEGNVSVTLKDVRLDVKQLNACSSATLKINSNLTKCKKNVNNFGSAFQRKILVNISLVFIQLILNSTSSPTMVWLKIEPTGKSTITCTRKLRSFTIKKITTESGHIPSTLTTSTATSDNLTDLHAEKEETSAPTNRNTLVVIISVVCVVCLLLVIAFIVFGWYLYTRRKKKEKRVDLPHEEQENGTPANNTNETPVQPNLRSPEYLPADNRLCESMYDKLQTNSCYYSEARASASNFQNPTFEDEYDNTQLQNVGNTCRDSNYDHVPFVNTKL